MGSRLEHLMVAGPAGALEAVVQESRSGGHRVACVVCHPHPLYGGTLNNKVVHRAAATLHALGTAVLRFNFRGAGKSEGRHDQGAGELEDARAALAFARARWTPAELWLAGFSFGAWIAARLAAQEHSVDRLLLIAPPVKTSSFEPLRTARVPKLVIQGSADDVCPLPLLETEFRTWAEPKRLVVVDGASHFFDRKLEPLAAAVRELMGGASQRSGEAAS